MAEAGRHLSPEAMGAAKSAAALMGMNNIFYRFQHLSGNERYGQIPAQAAHAGAIPLSTRMRTR